MKLTRIAMAILAICCVQAATGLAADEPLYVILKADDLRVKKPEQDVHPAWTRFVNDIESRKIKASIGIICQCLENECPKLEAWVKEQHAKGSIEFWNHGYSHLEMLRDGKKLCEFKGVPLEEQAETLRKSQQLAKKRFGFELTAFGSPFNAFDENTSVAIAQFPEITVWFYGRPSPKAKDVLVLDRPINMEQPTLSPNFDKFTADFAKLKKDCKVITLQGHPESWSASEERFSNFERILDFLIERKARFVTPSEYLKIAKEMKK